MPFASPLSVTVVLPNGHPARHVQVAFSAPTAGPSAVLSDGLVLTGSDGVATVNAVANDVPGSYVVTATANRLSVTFSLSNVVSPTLTQVLQQNTLVAGKTTALRLYTGPETASHVASARAEVVKPDGSTVNTSWSGSDIVAIPADANGSSVVVRIPGALVSVSGSYRVTARLFDAQGVPIGNYQLNASTLLPTRDLRLLVVFLVHPGFFNADQSWYDDINDAMQRLGALYPIRDGVKQGFDNPPSAGLEYVVGTPCDGYSVGYYDCVYGQTRAFNAQPGPHIDVTVEYRPGFYAPEFNPPGDPYPGGNAGPPPAPYSDLHRANCVAGVWNGIHVTAPACGHEIGHNFGLEASCSPHWDGGLHSKDYEITPQFAFDALKNVPYPTHIGDIMDGGWDHGRDAATLNEFDWEYARKALLGIPRC